MNTYYISSLNGSDAASGLGTDQAWASFDHLHNIDFQAGDTIYLEAGSIFNDTLCLMDVYGAEGLPITITSYGDGAPALITSSDSSAIQANRTSNIHIENIQIGETVNAGIEGLNSHHWTVRNVTFNGSGGVDKNFGAFNWDQGDNLVFENNTVLDSYGDGVFLNQVDTILIRNNIFDGVHGNAADNIQIDGTNAVIEHNIISYGDDQDATKGNIVFQGDNLYMADNYLEGGGFGLSASADQVVVQDNIIVGHDRYSWSGGVMLGDSTNGDVMNGLSVTGNYFSGGSNGVTMYGGMETTYSSDIMQINDLNISENHFLDWSSKAVRFTQVDANGVYQDNTYYQSYDERWSDSFAGSDISDLSRENNTFSDPLLLAMPAPKEITITASASLYQGAPIMCVWHNGELVLETEVHAVRKAGDRESFTVTLDDYNVTDTIKISYSNDRHHLASGQDRNLYLHEITVDGEPVSLRDGHISGKAYNSKYSKILYMNGKSSVSFSGEAMYLDQEAQSINIDDLLDQNSFLETQATEGRVIGAGHASSVIAPDYSYVHQTLETVHGEVF